MMGLTRLAEPAILTTKAKEWTASYLAGESRRPPSSRYAHPEIVDTLRAMSFGKCFYCEQRLAEGAQEVDHYVEVAEDRARAFLWINLYLSCKGCNRKLSNRTKPASTCLDPCDPGAEPRDHLTFEGDVISARDSSMRGLNTIQKYALHRDELNLKRSRQLRRFTAALLEIKDQMIAKGRKEPTDAEKEILRRFRQKDHPFSLMFTVQLAAVGL
jgi:uncharacterized protein (TIGR02646 family)